MEGHAHTSYYIRDILTSLHINSESQTILSRHFLFALYPENHFFSFQYEAGTCFSYFWRVLIKLLSAAAAGTLPFIRLEPQYLTTNNDALLRK